MENGATTDKLKRAAEVVCKQGMVQFPVSDTAIAIIDRVVGDNEEELDLIFAFRERPSQTLDQLKESSGFSSEKAEQLATSLAKKGLIFNQNVSADPACSGYLLLLLGIDKRE